MTDLQALLLVVIVVYLVETAIWLRKGSVAFVAFFSRHLRAIDRPPLIGNDRGGFVMAHPLPPFGTAYVAHQWPLSIAPQGVYAWVAASVGDSRRLVQAEHYIPFAELDAPAFRGKEVWAGSARLAVVASAARAKHIAEVLAGLKKLAVAKRSRAIEKIIARQLDPTAVEERLAALRRHTRWLRVATYVTFASLFVAIPTAINLRLLGWYWAAWLLPLIPLVATTCTLYAVAHRRLFGDDKGDRRFHLLLMGASPPAAIRAMDALASRLLVEADPLAVARAVCTPGDFEAFAAKTLRDLEFPIAPPCPDDGEAREVEAWYRARFRAAVEKLVERAGLDPTTLLSAPSPIEDDNRGYCPRCCDQFVIAEGECKDCGLPLAPLAQPST